MVVIDATHIQHPCFSKLCGYLSLIILTGLPDEDGRVEIFQIHTAQMTKFKKMDSAVDLNELAKRTRNFTGAEIESVVRSAQATAMNRLIEVGSVIMWH